MLILLIIRALRPLLRFGTVFVVFRKYLIVRLFARINLLLYLCSEFIEIVKHAAAGSSLLRLGQQQL